MVPYQYRLFFVLITFCVVVMGMAAPLHAGGQQVNPFDIFTPETYQQWLDSVQALEQAAEERTDAAVQPPGGEIGSFRNGTSLQDRDATTSQPLSDWFFLGYSFILVMLVSLIFSVGRNEVFKSWRAFFNQNALNTLYKEKIEFKYSVYAMLYLLYFLVMGLWIFRLSGYFGYSPVSEERFALLASLGVIVGLILSKHFILWVIASVFPLEKALTKYNFLILIFNQVLAIALLPLLIVHLFSAGNISYYAMLMAIIMLGFVYLVRSFRALLLSSDHLVSNKFHFFIYLCTVEIAPLAIAIRIVIDL